MIDERNISKVDPSQSGKMEMSAVEGVSSGKKIKNIIWNIILGMSVLILLFAAVSVTFFNRDDAFLFGYKPFIISSESMEPVYKKYAVVLAQNGTYDDVKVGDLIAFKAEKIGGKPAFHRVIKITPEGFITKGDANKLPDDQVVNRESFLGRRVWHTNVTATLIPLVQTPQGFMYLVVLPVALIALIVIFAKVLKGSLRKDYA